MINRPRTNSKSHTVLIQESIKKTTQNQMPSVSPLRSHKTVPLQPQQQLFQKVLALLQEYFFNSSFRDRVMQMLKKQVCSQPPEPQVIHLSLKRMGAGSIKRAPVQSFKKMTMDSKICCQYDYYKHNDSGSEEQLNIIRNLNKKISIFVNMQQQSSQSNSIEYSDSLCSQQQVRSLYSICLPSIPMNLQTIVLIYQTPQPFLITLSLCLLLRYSSSCTIPASYSDSTWILSLSTIIAYKLYYDQQIEGLLQCFADILKVNKQDLIDLQRCFLQTINYNTVISNLEYQAVLTELCTINIE